MYSLKACEDLITKYVHQFNGQCTTIREGVLGLGTILLHGAPGKKTILINEIYLNAWSSGHKIRMYNRMPKKYSKLLLNH